jgi:hypothetical protein
MQSFGQKINPSMQLIINAAELAITLQLIRGETEARQHDDENQPIPELQPPLDGFKNLHSMQ